MNKTFAKITYYTCFVLALIILYVALNSAGGLAYAGKQPSVWLGVLAFSVAVALVVVAIIIKSRFKI